MFGSNCQPRNTPETEQVGGFAECRKVRQALRAVPPFPVDADGRKDFILRTGEALAVLDLLCFHNVGKAVHLSKAHTTPANFCPDGAAD